MKILYIHQHFSTPKGSVGNRSYQMARALIDRGHDVTMLCGRYAGGETGLMDRFVNGRREGMVDGIRVIECDLPYSNTDGFLARSFTFVKFVARTTHIALMRKYDLLFATTTPLTVAVPGIVARWLRGKPFLFEVRDLWPELPKAMGVIRNPLVLGALSALEWVGYRSADRLVGLSPGIVEGIKRCGVPEGRIKLIPNGCDLDLFSGTGEAVELPVPVGDDVFVAVYAGTHGKANGLTNLLVAAAELQRRGHEDIAILLVGNGSEKSALIAQADGLRNVHFLDPMPKSQIAELFKRADLGLQCLANIPAFYYGTSPNKFFDYLSAGLPVLCNYPGWVADLIADHDCGFAVPPGAPGAFADALAAAANNRLALIAKGRNARRLAEVEFDRNDLADKWCNWVIGGPSEPEG